MCCNGRSVRVSVGEESAVVDDVVGLCVARWLGIRVICYDVSPSCLMLGLHSRMQVLNY
jgi:hypothetical protein